MFGINMEKTDMADRIMESAVDAVRSARKIELDDGQIWTGLVLAMRDAGMTKVGAIELAAYAQLKYADAVLPK